MMFIVFILPTSNTQASPSAEPTMAPLRACRSPASSSLIACCRDRTAKEWWAFLPAQLWCLSLSTDTLWSELPSCSNHRRGRKKGKVWSGVFFREFAPQLGSTPERSEGAWQGGRRSCLKVWRQIDRERERERDG